MSLHTNNDRVQVEVKNIDPNQMNDQRMVNYEQMQMNPSMHSIPQFSNNRSSSNQPPSSSNSTFASLSPNQTIVSHQSHAQLSNPANNFNAAAFRQKSQNAYYHYPN